ncbi:MAG: GatB/YqeY domain-containing protein [Chloroflexi bacterium]|nr:MAG: GatB/YqeY domain-containing protein [Chloroflexota bacterium]
MSLKAKLQQDLKEALRRRDEVRKRVLRMALTAIKNAEVEARGELTDEQVLTLLQKEAKKREETLEALAGADRPDLVAQERAELEVLRSYLPRQLSREEIEAAAREVIAQVGASGPRDIGKVMKPLMAQLRGRADGRLVNQIVRELLG